MTTQLIAARNGIITDEVKMIAIAEDVDPYWLSSMLAKGKIVILKNKNHNIALS